jgi:toxin CptA
MQDAPSVTCPVGRSVFGGALMAAVWLAGAVAALMWSAQPGLAAWRLALAWSAVAVAGALALRSWLGASAGVLAWDGNAWSWSEGAGARPAASGQLELSLDLQHTMLARWHDGGAGRRWLWLERRRCPGRWNDVRRAVYSRAGSPARAAEPPAAKP